MPERLRLSLMATAPYLLALASIVATRGFKAFGLAEALAVAAFACGLAVYLMRRQESVGAPAGWPQRLLLVGSVVGLAGLPLKLLFSMLGIGAEQHSMAGHATTTGNPLLMHIHHLFFNLGFVILLASALVLFAGRARGRKRAGTA